MSKEKFSRRSFLQFTALGLSACSLLACDRRLGLDNPQPAKTSVPLPSPAGVSPTPEQTRPPTPTYLIDKHPPATDTPAPTGEPPVTISDPLPVRAGYPYNPDQLARLQAAAQRFVAGTPAEANRVAKDLRYNSGYEHPSSMGGPLSVAILREAGFISAYIDLHDFWILNPRPAEDIAILETIFPKSIYLWYFNQQSIRDIDFSQFPLQAGDFLYIFAGEGGTFEQMCTVSRVDEAGRVYSVTNVNTPAGFIIQEVMLYDPAQPGTGQFATWTDRKYLISTGTTGFGGLQVWRRTTPLLDPGPAEQSLAREIDDLLAQTGGAWRIVFKELDGGVVYARQEHHKLHPASVIKVPIAMLWFKSVEKWGRLSNAEFLDNGFDDRTYRQLLQAMLVDSEEAATDSLLRSIEVNKLDIPSTLREWGAPVTEVYNRLSTAWETVTLLEGLYAGRCISPTARQVILDLMSVYTPGDDLRLGYIHKLLPAGYSVYNKRGTLTQDMVIVADAGIMTIPISHGERTYVAALFAYQDKSGVSFNQLEGAMQELAFLFWKYTRLL